MDYAYHAMVDMIFKMEHVSTPPQIMPYQLMLDVVPGRVEFVWNAQIIGFSTSKAHAFQYLTNARPSILKENA